MPLPYLFTTTEIMICASIVVPLEYEAHPPFWPLLGQTQSWGNHEEGGRRSLYIFIFCLTSRNFSLSLIKGRLQSHRPQLSLSMWVEKQLWALSWSVSGQKTALLHSAPERFSAAAACKVHTWWKVWANITSPFCLCTLQKAARASQGFCSAPTLTVWPTRLIKSR